MCKRILQLNSFFDDFFTNKVMLNIYILHSKVINKIFREYLSFLIVAINNDSDKTINEFESFINYENVVNIDKYVKRI